MAKDFKPSISVEEMAAYLDGNLPKEEMDALQAFIEEDVDILDLLNESSIVDDVLLFEGTDTFQLEFSLGDNISLPDPLEKSSLDMDFASVDDLFFHDEDNNINEQNELSNVDHLLDFESI